MIGTRFEGLFIRVALNDHWLVKDELSILHIVAPNTPRSWERRSAAEFLAKQFQGLADPRFLIDWLFLPIDTWNEQDKERRFCFISPKTIGKIGHAQDLLRSFAGGVTDKLATHLK